MSIAAFTLIEIVAVTAIIALISGFSLVHFMQENNKKTYQRSVSEFIDTLQRARSEIRTANARQCAVGARLHLTFVRKIDLQTYSLGYQCENDFLSSTPSMAPSLILWTKKLASPARFENALTAESPYFLSATHVTYSRTEPPSSPILSTSPLVILGATPDICTCIKIFDTGVIEASSSCSYVPGSIPIVSCTY